MILGVSVKVFILEVDCTVPADQTLNGREENKAALLQKPGTKSGYSPESVPWLAKN